MFANFTEETCTGTGSTLALAGATTGNIVFSESFADGELVAYVLEDSGGTIKVAGVGAYVSATDDITRADTWNWNGTVIDDTPSTNITLSGGTHTVRCGSIDDDFETGGIVSGRIYISSRHHERSSNASITINDISYFPLEIRDGKYDAFAFEVNTAGTNIRLGLYSVKNGLPDALLAVHDTSFSVGTTGLKQPSFDGGALNLRKGDYYIGANVDDNLSLRASQADSHSATQLGGADVSSQAAEYRKVRTYTTMPDPADLSGGTFDDANAIIMGVVAA